MAWVTPSSRSTGTLITAVIWNQDVVDNPSYLKGLAGVIAFEDGASFTKSQNTTTAVVVDNVNAGTGAIAAVFCRNTAASTDGVSLACFGTGFTTSGANRQDGATLNAQANLSGGLSIVAAHATTGVMRFYTAGAADANLRIQIDADGDVGIGTASIDSRLHVATNGAACQVTIEDEAGGADSLITFKDAGTSVYSLGWDESLGGFSLSASGTLGTTEVIRCTGSGGVSQLQTAGSTSNMLQLAAAGSTLQCASDLAFGIDSDNNASGSVFTWLHNGATLLMQLVDTGLLSLNDTTNANMTFGFTLNQGAADNQILAFKSSDVAHGLTSAGAYATETDDYGTFQKLSATAGGLAILGAMENAAVTNAVQILSYGGQASATKSQAGRGLIELYAAQHDGANALADIAADGNVFAVRGRRGGADITLMIIDEDGDAHNDGTGWTAYDDHDDVMLCNAIDVALGGVDPVKAGFTAFLEDNRQTLQRLKLVNFDESGRPFVNSTKMISLLIGTARQLGRRNSALEQRVADLETRMLAA